METVDNHIREEMVVDRIITKIKEYNLSKPRIHVTYKFPNMPEQPEVEIFDSYVQIRELVKFPDGSISYIPVVIGQSISDDLSDKTIEMVDIRVIKDHTLFNEAISLFNNIINNHNTSENIIEDEYDPMEMAALIMSTWDLADQLTREIIH